MKKAMKWDSAGIAAHNQPLGATRYSPSPLPHSRLHHMPLLTHSRPHYVPLLPHCRPHHMPLLPHARPHHCCLTIAASLCILTTAVSLLAPDSDGEETKEHNRESKRRKKSELQRLRRDEQPESLRILQNDANRLRMQQVRGVETLISV